MHRLIEKYNIPGPRYTSYPTVPYWDDAFFSKQKWIESLKRSFIESNAEEGISLYIHLPFCESLCTFCACNKHITKQHKVEEPYIKAILKEWQLYRIMLPDKPKIKELHIGGGTPTFFSSENLNHLISQILKDTEIPSERAFSFEGHPNNTHLDHLKTLFDLGFTRISLGVQDYSQKVQKAINRLQSFERVAYVTEQARKIGYTSVCHDLIFGLPFQSMGSILDTMDKTSTIKPDRIAFYSYAHVPWIKGNGQRGFDETDLPSGDQKRMLYEEGRKKLEQIGYIEIGMDHFSMPNDKLYESAQRKTLHRNFMGYSSSKTQLMIGLGASSISDSWYAFAQNEKTIKDYYIELSKDNLPVYRGHILTSEDRIIRKHILDLMCRLETKLQPNESHSFYDVNAIKRRLKEMEEDHLVHISSNTLSITPIGRAFIRNICMALDLRLLRKQPDTRLFSMTV